MNATVYQRGTGTKRRIMIDKYEFKRRVYFVVEMNEQNTNKNKNKPTKRDGK